MKPGFLIKIIVFVLISIGIGFLDFYLIRKWNFMFYIHTVLTYVTGSLLVYFAYKLQKKKSGNKVVNIIIMLIGIIQITIHITNQIIGR